MSIARFDLARALTLTGRPIGFEVLDARGASMLTLVGSDFNFGRLKLMGDLTVAALQMAGGWATIAGRAISDLLTGGRASPASLGAAPLLVDAEGVTDGSAFAQIAPQPSATASQISVEQGLDLARPGRSGVLAAPHHDATGPYTFAAAPGRVGRSAVRMVSPACGPTGMVCSAGSAGQSRLVARRPRGVERQPAVAEVVRGADRLETA